MIDDEAPTISQVKRAGRTLRHWARGEDVDVEGALTIVQAFRAQHSRPLVKANNGLRSMILTEGCPVEVSQRLKRLPTIVDKLVNRETTLSLDRMQDIGGVRAILDNVDQLRRVEKRLKKRRQPVAYSDYIERPRDSGYRGVHVIVDYDGRRIEVQLRTRVMHAWAVTVERLSASNGQNFKQDGSSVVQLLMAAISEAMAYEECGEEPPFDLVRRMDELREQARPFLGTR